MAFRVEDLILSIPTPPDTVLHIGAGYARELDDYLSLKAGKIYLVEANEELVSRARAKTSKLENVTVINKAVAPQAGLANLNVTNNLRLSSLLQPREGFYEYYPNVEVTDRRQVAAITLDELCATLLPDQGTRNLLVIETPGLEDEILASARAETLDRFSWILVRACRPGMYASHTPRQTENSQPGLAGSEFTLFRFKEDAAPFTCFLYLPNPAVRELAEARQALQISQEQKTGELDEAHRALRLSNKLTAKLSADLADLQKRYEDAIENQQQQHALLCKLKDKLTRATELYRQLSLEDQPAAGDVLEPKTLRFVDSDQ
jgi:FkbM family methyltransferase